MNTLFHPRNGPKALNLYNTVRRSLNLPSRLHDLEPQLHGKSEASTAIMHATATVDGKTIASSDSFQMVEGNIYFPLSSVEDESKTLVSNSHTTNCPWKGASRYYDVHVGGKTLKNAAWGYPEPKEQAMHIKDHVAFGKYTIHW